MARNKRQALSDEQIEEAVQQGIYGREQIAARFGISESAARRAEPVIRAIARERERAGGKRPKGSSLPRNWNGTPPKARVRELKSYRARGGDTYPGLLTLQLRISELSAALASVRVEDYGLDQVSLARLTDMHDDLLALADWMDRTLSSVQARLSDTEVRAKIAMLRNISGFTEHEAKTRLALADRLERKLGNRLASSPAPAR
jgi:bacterioferritin-associated ferredoxin